jgi:hypothetical protein
VKAKHMMFGDDKKLAPSDLNEDRLHIQPGWVNNA